MSRLSLFEISRAKQDALEELLEAEETLLAVQSTRNAPADDLQVAKNDYEAALLDLETIADARGKKLENYAKFIQNLAHLKNGLEYQIKTYQRRKNAVVRTLDWLKQNLSDYLTMTDKKSINAGEFKIAKQKSAPSVVIEIPVEELPADFQRVTIEPNKNELRRAIQSGATIDGVKVVRKEHVRIRTR